MAHRKSVIVVGVAIEMRPAKDKPEGWTDVQVADEIERVLQQHFNDVTFATGVRVETVQTLDIQAKTVDLSETEEESN